LIEYIIELNHPPLEDQFVTSEYVPTGVFAALESNIPEALFVVPVDSVCLRVVEAPAVKFLPMLPVPFIKVATHALSVTVLIESVWFVVRLPFV